MTSADIAKSKMSFEGSQLRMAAGEFFPWVYIQHREDRSLLSASGILIDVINMIATKMKFTYSLIEPPDLEWGLVLPNGSTTGMIGMCQRKEVDFALGPFSITYPRSKVIDFSEPLDIDQSGIFLPRPKKTSDLSSFLKPFSWEVWLFLAISLLVSEAIGCLLIWSYGQAAESNDQIQNGAEKSLTQACKPVWFARLLVNEPVEVQPKFTSFYVLVSAWVLIAVILNSAYQGVLTSMLTVPKFEIPVDSMRDLITYGKMPWVIERGTELHQYLQEATNGDRKTILDGAGFISYSYYEKDRMKKEGFAMLSDHLSMKQIMSEDYTETGECNYYIAKEQILTLISALAFPKGSHLTPHFNKWIIRLKQAGLIEKYQQESTSNATVCLITPGKVDGTPDVVLSLADMAGVFVLYIGGK